MNAYNQCVQNDPRWQQLFFIKVPKWSNNVEATTLIVWHATLFPDHMLNVLYILMWITLIIGILQTNAQALHNLSLTLTHTTKTLINKTINKPLATFGKETSTNKTINKLV